MKIYLTRHGETEWNVQGRIQSHGDSPLTISGIKTSKEIHDKLVNVKFDKIYTSDLGRAVQTAKIIRGSRPIEIIKLEGIREINMDRWKGKSLIKFNGEENALNNNLYNFPHKYEPEDNETYCDFYHRTIKTIDLILDDKKSENILIVSHFHTVRVILSHLKKVDIKDIPKEYPYIKNSDVHIIEVNQ